MRRKMNNEDSKKEGSRFFFELATPRDMLEKARREHRRLTERFHVDNVFNFFVTAYHIKDYIQHNGSVSHMTWETFLKDQDMQDCHNLCDKGKHLILTQKNRSNPATHMISGCYGGTPFGTIPWGGCGKWVLITNGREVDVESLAKRVLEKWDVFFEEHGL